MRDTVAAADEVGKGGGEVLGWNLLSAKMISPKKSADRGPEKTALRNALYHLDLLLAPPPVGLGCSPPPFQFGGAFQARGKPFGHSWGEARKPERLA